MKQIWHFLGKVAVVAGLLLGLFAIAELVRIYLFFHSIHPYVGYGAALLLLLFLVGSWIYLRVQLRDVPRVLEPPERPDAETGTTRQVRAYANYLVRYQRRLARNPHLPKEQRLLALQGADDLEYQLAARPDKKTVLDSIERTDREVCLPLLKLLDEQARKHVRASTRDIMLAVTISPYHTVDILIVVYRNAVMVFDVIKIYRGRPGPREQWRMVGDTLKVVGTVNVLNISRNLFESLFSRLPVVGKVADDISQGLGAGFFTSLAGHAAMNRCSAYQGWSRDRAVTGVTRKARLFLEDVRDMFLKDVLPEMRGRSRLAEAKPGEDESRLWDGIARGVSGAVDATSEALDQWLVKPVRSGTQSMVGAGTALLVDPFRRNREPDPLDELAMDEPVRKRRRMLFFLPRRKSRKQGRA